jgi:hypothetical protein
LATKESVTPQTESFGANGSSSATRPSPGIKKKFEKRIFPGISAQDIKQDIVHTLLAKKVATYDPRNWEIRCFNSFRILLTSSDDFL